MMTNPSDQYAAAPLEVRAASLWPLTMDMWRAKYASLRQTNMFDWHFTLRGPRDTEFEGGIYHGRILLPTDYPFKPPNIILLTVGCRK